MKLVTYLNLALTLKVIKGKGKAIPVTGCETQGIVCEVSKAPIFPRQSAHAWQ
jgi:hypothetical protein